MFLVACEGEIKGTGAYIDENGRFWLDCDHASDRKDIAGRDGLPCA